MMPNGLIRLFRSGLRDADERLARALAPRPSLVADRYLASSVTVRVVDGFLQRWSAVWRTAASHAALINVLDSSCEADWTERYESMAWVILVAAATHILLTAAHGPRPGWFWMVIPAMAIGFGVLLLAAARSASSHR